MGQTDRQSMRKVMKFLLAVTFLASIQAYHLGYYQPYVVYPQFYQTFPNIRIPRPITEQQIESHQKNYCKNNIGEVVPCYKIFAEKLDQSRIEPVMSNVFKSINEKIQEIAKLPAFKKPVNPIFYSISQDNEENSLAGAIETACQGWKEQDSVGSFRKFADFLEWLKYEVDEWFGQSKEDLIFRKLTGQDEFFVKDLSGGFRSVADLIEDTCANPSAEDAGTKFLNISAELGDLQVPEVETDEKVQNYTETVCGWEKSQHIPDLEDVSGDSIADIPIMLEVIQDIQENSKDWKCAIRVTKYLNGSIDLMIKMREIIPSNSPQ